MKKKDLLILNFLFEVNHHVTKLKLDIIYFSNV